MKILQINKYLKIVGGAETYMFQLSKALQERGIEVRFWGMEDEGNIIQDFKGLEATNIDYSDQNFKTKITSALDTIYSRNNRKKIAEVLRIYKPDIVHIHNYNFQITPSILPEINRLKIKVVQTIHDSQMICPYHRLYNFQRNETCTKCVKGSFFNCVRDRCFDGSILKSTIGAAESMFYHSKGYYEKYIDTYISPSYFLANLIKNRVDKEIIVIPNFTDTSVDISFNKPQKEYYLYFGRISEEKGILELVEIFKKTNFKLLIVGKGPLEDELKSNIKSLNNIKFVGPKYNNELFSIIKHAKYVVQLSKGFENCPMAIIESYSFGVPVIGPNHSGFKDLINDGETGYLLNSNNNSEVILRLEQIDKLNVLPLKEKVYDYYKNNLSEKIHLEKILMVYNNLLKL